MSVFLWVEDFNEGNHAQVTFQHFGEMFGSTLDEFPRGNLPSLKRFLNAKGVILATTYADARRLIDERLEDFDFVVLDIDLELFGEDQEEDEPKVLPELAWYGYDPTVSRADEKSYDEAVIAMRPVAGYHLWKHLVINRGFPKDRIQFCSQHGEYQESLKKSFKPAKIEAPDIFRKGDGRIGPWIKKHSRTEYLLLRRNVISFCEEVSKYLKSYSEDRKRTLTLARLPGPSTIAFTRDLALEWLEGLPLYLPSNVESNSVPGILLGFVRAMTIEWDRFDARREFRDQFKERESYDYDAVEDHIRHGSAVLKLLRNTVSHGSISSVMLDCQDVAMFFILNMNVIFDLSEAVAKDPFESRLLSFGDASLEIPQKIVIGILISSKTDIEQLATSNSETGVPVNNVGAWMRELQKTSCPSYQSEAGKWLLVMLWLELMQSRRLEHSYEFEKKLRRICQAKNLVHRVAVASFQRAFRAYLSHPAGSNG